MKEQNKPVIKFIVIVSLCISSCLVISYFVGTFLLTEPNANLDTKTISSTSGVSEFEPKSILTSINTGESVVFSDAISSDDSNYSKDVEFENVLSDKDLYTVANYYFQSIWGEDIDSWELININYYLYNCKNAFNGAYSVYYTFEKKITIENEKFVNVRTVWISEWKNQIGWTDEIVNRTKLSYSLNWEKMNIFALDAYNLAEEHGGREIHTGSNDECVDINLKLYGYDSEWEIDYNDHLGYDLLELKIDSITGEIKE